VLHDLLAAYQASLVCPVTEAVLAVVSSM
jgi:hypothetical protein